MRIDAMSEISQLYQVNSSPRKKAEKTSGYTKDSVEISEFGRDLQIAKQAVAQAEDIRTDKVQELKAKMANGTYNVSMSALADKLLSGLTL
ncbi:MAG: flagellar biosynthesis anti-sigma factor FlgM [Lachnospiraceae bacterium]|nr:flagellar biosynthesis anti-sigma factor FlgM [Lachnospiraceae bacterium]MBP3610149.1 flagellar biosynthesis anti-sigma factor FlgM [Lachnospiraceae bacterium]